MAAGVIERTSCLLSSVEGGRRMPRPPSILPRGEDRRRGVIGSHVCHARRRRTMLSMPLTCSSTLDHRTQLRGCVPDVLRGGALEPGAQTTRVKQQAKAETITVSSFPVRMRRRAFLSQAGPHVRSGFLKLGITSRSNLGFWLYNNKGRPVGSPSHELLCGQTSSAHTSQRGPAHSRASGSRPRANPGNAVPRRPGPSRAVHGFRRSST